MVDLLLTGLEGLLTILGKLWTHGDIFISGILGLFGGEGAYGPREFFRKLFRLSRALLRRMRPCFAPPRHNTCLRVARNLSFSLARPISDSWQRWTLCSASCCLSLEMSSDRGGGFLSRIVCACVPWLLAAVCQSF